MDAFENALKEIVMELERKYSFYLHDNGDEDLKTVIRKHMSPLINVDVYRKKQIELLRAQLADLETSA